MVNGHVAVAFEELATLLDLAGESPFKTRAYRAFAERARELAEPLAQLDARGELEDLPGVGNAIAGKVRELLEGGTMGALERARAEVPATLPDLLRISGLGPARVRKLWQELGVTSLAELVGACHDGRLAAHAGFGPKLASRVCVEAEAALSTVGQVLLAHALAVASWASARLIDAGATRVRTAGAARRGVEIVDEVVLVVMGLSPSEVALALEASDDDAPPFRVAMPSALASDEVGPALIATPIGSEGPRLRVRCTTSKRFVEALVVETGDEAHVAALAAHALARKTTLRAACEGAADEEAAYAALGLPAIPPELRELGIVTPSRDLLPVRGVKGVFHVHTTWSDGVASIAEMAQAASEAGFAYVGISDHSRAASYANGLDVARLRRQRDEIVRARAAVADIEILHGIEVDILEDGSLDLPDDVLAELDFVVASVHTHFQLDRAAQTKRIVRAVSHPLVTILGHPTGRLLLGRAGYDYDLDQVARAAAASEVCLEINASPQRLDLCPSMIRQAAAHGARFCINPDAHEPRGFGDVPLGVSQARRAALRLDQVLNSRGTRDVIAGLRARRAKGAAMLGVAAPTS